MNELGALLSILPYALTIAVLAALFRRLIDAREGPSLAELVSGRRDLPWPQGVQEEEPVRWHVEALRPRRDQRQAEVTCTELDRPRSAMPATRSGQAVRRGA